MKRTPLKRKSPLAKVSARRKKERKSYSTLRREFLTVNPICQCCKAAEATDVHHAAKRGRFYLRAETWKALCRPCHDRCEQNSDWAKSVGMTLTTEQRRLLS